MVKRHFQVYLCLIRFAKKFKNAINIRDLYITNVFLSLLVGFKLKLGASPPEIHPQLLLQQNFSKNSKYLSIIIIIMKTHPLCKCL